MKEVTRYVADDGTEWETEDLALQQDARFNLSKELLAIGDVMWHEDSAMEVATYLLKTFNLSRRLSK